MKWLSVYSHICSHSKYLFIEDNFRTWAVKHKTDIFQLCYGKTPITISFPLSYHLPILWTCSVRQFVIVSVIWQCWVHTLGRLFCSLLCNCQDRWLNHCCHNDLPELENPLSVNQLQNCWGHQGYFFVRFCFCSASSSFSHLLQFSFLQ